MVPKPLCRNARSGRFGYHRRLVVSVIVKIVIILIPLILTVAYLTYFERKVIGFMQLRVART